MIWSAESLFGITLLLAASLKAQAIIHGDARHTVWLASAQSAAEWLLAAWLLCGLARKWASRMAVVALVVFAAVAALRLLAGRADCGCFGNVQVHPGWTLGLDVTLLAMLLWRQAGGRHLADTRGALLGPRILFVVMLCTVTPSIVLWNLRPLSPAGDVHGSVRIEAKDFSHS